MTDTHANDMSEMSKTDLCPRSSKFKTRTPPLFNSNQFYIPPFARASSVVKCAQSQRRADRNRGKGKNSSSPYNTTSSPSLMEENRIADNADSVSLRQRGDAMPRNSGENIEGESVASRHSGETQSKRGERSSEQQGSEYLRERGGMSQKRDHSQTGEVADELFNDNRSYQTPDTVNSRLFRNGSQGSRSRRTRSRLEPWNKPQKTRSKFSEKISWNGRRDTFREYRKTIEGHLLQVDAGYLTDTDFLTEYEIHRADNQHMEYLTSEAFWSKHGVSFLQAKCDKQYLYGILVSTTTKIDNKVILTNKKDQDGILAWIQMTRDYDYGGSIELRISDIDDEVRKPYSLKYPGGLTEYIERYQTLMAELDIIAPLEYSDIKKRKLLIKNIRRTPRVAHLTQRCTDSDMSYEMTADYLTQNVIILEHDSTDHTPKPIIPVPEAAVEHVMDVTKDTPELEREDAQSENSNSIEAGGIPTQGPNVTVNVIKKVNDPVTDPAVLLHSLNASPLDVADTEENNDFRRIYTTISSSDVPETPFSVQAHLDYATPFSRNYAILDSGADSCCLGKHCHPVSYTGRHAILVGYNHNQTRSGKVPIVTAYIKVMSQMNRPVVLRVHEAPYIQDSCVTLISEYQVRENGIIIDSVSKRHKTVNGTFGTQRMILSDHVYVPFFDRGGVLGYEILPWKEGDEYVYDVYNITRDTPWKPHQFCDNEDIHVTNSTAASIDANMNINETTANGETIFDCYEETNCSKRSSHWPSTRDTHSEYRQLYTISMIGKAYIREHRGAMISKTYIPEHRGAHEVGPGEYTPFDRGKRK